MDAFEITKLVVDIVCIIFLLGLAWMWVIGAPVDHWLAKKEEKRRLIERLERNIRWRKERHHENH